jgi:hypothetical protein
VEKKGNGFPKFTPTFFLELVHLEPALEEDLAASHLLGEGFPEKVRVKDSPSLCSFLLPTPPHSSTFSKQLFNSFLST